MEIWDEIKASFREGSVITRLIYVNLAVFLVFRVLHLFFFLTANNFDLITWFELPAHTGQFLRQPWSLFTYMFLHFDFLHILFNLLVLYWFGRIFLDYYTPRQLLGLYFTGGIAGGLVFIAAFQLFPVFEGVIPFSRLLGASAAIIAILIATAVCDPSREIHLFLIGRVPLKYLALFMVISYVIGISTSNAGGNFAHLGGAAAGVAFTLMWRKGTDITAVFSWLTDAFARFFKPGRAVRLVHKQPPRDDYEYNRQRNASHEELNRILDKISHEGYDRLTREEKETLFRHGK